MQKRERERAYQFTIGRKIAFAFLLILIMMGVMIGITIYGHNIAIRSYESISEGASEQGAAGNVRFGVAQLIMFANDYIITGKDDYRRMFELQRIQVEDYQQKLRGFRVASEEVAILDSISAAVDSIYAYAHRIFAIPRPRFSSEAAPLMEIMDYKFGYAVNRKTTEIFDIVLRRIEVDKIQSALTRDRMRNTLYTVFLLGLLVSVVIVYLSSWRIAKPIRMVAKAADAIAKGDYSQRPAVSTRDEVGLLARSLSQMAKAIEKAHQELESRKRFTENIVATVPSGLLVIGEPDRQSQQVGDRELKIISVNRSFCELFTVKQQDVVGQPVEAVISAIGLSQQCRDAVAARKPFRNVECMCSTPGKGEMTLNVALSGIRVAEEEEEEEEVLLVIDDITERKKAEESLRESQQDYMRFFEEDITGDYISTLDGRIRACNPAFVRMFGFASREEALGTNAVTLYQNPMDRRKIVTRIERERRVEYHKLEMVRRDGTPLHIVANFIGRFDETGRLVELQGYLFDDTKRSQLEQQLIHAQKIEGLGTLASGIAHDFNNLLGIIIANASIIERLPLDRDTIQKNIDAIIKASMRGASLVKQMLTFARKTDVIIELNNLNDTVNEVVILLHETFPKKITVELQLNKGLPKIEADATQLHQVILNLCVNARDAMPNGGTLTIKTEIVPGKTLRAKYPKAASSEYISLTIKDTGTGMDEETQMRIFEPFFTTKEIGKGTGLGLSLVFGIIETHNGFISVQSEIGKGTTFQCCFPVHHAAQNSIHDKKQTKDDSPGGNETILVVEDEDLLRKVVQMFLESKGYTVISAEDGEEGLNFYKKNQNEIALVLSDLGLPKLGGDELHIKLTEVDPHVRMIIASGYVEPGMKAKFIEAGVVEFIQKPYEPNEVLRAIRRVLDKK